VNLKENPKLAFSGKFVHFATLFAWHFLL